LGLQPAYYHVQNTWEWCNKFNQLCVLTPHLCNISSSSLTFMPEIVFSLQTSWSNSCMHLIWSHSCNILFLSHFNRFCHLDNIRYEKLLKSHSSLLLGSNAVLCFSVTVADQILKQFKILGEIIHLCNMSIVFIF
jgi:hypothetical protein